MTGPTAAEMEIKIPQLSDTMTEGFLVAWLVTDGALVRAGELIYVLETDKATLESESPAAGTLQILKEPASSYPVGTVIGKLRESTRPVAITYREGTQPQRIYAFVRGQNNHLYVNYWNGAQWQWADQGTPPGTTVTGQPGVITYLEAGKQRIYAFVRGENDHLYVNYWNGAQWQWADQGTPPGTTVTGQPGVITYLEAGKQRIYAFVRGQNDHLYVNYWNGAQWQWADQGTPPGAIGYSPGVITYLDEAGKQRIYAFFDGENKRFYVNYWNGAQWQWVDQGTPPGTTVTGQPGVITYLEAGKQRIYAFVRGQNDHLYVNYWNGARWQWADQGTPPGTIGYSLGVITYLDDAGKQRIYAFFDGENKRLYVNYWNGAQWQWADQGTPPGTTVTGQPEVITYLEAGKQRIYAFVYGENKRLYVNYWNGAQWQWADQGTP